MAKAVNVELFAPRLQSALKVAGENTYTLAAHVSLAPSTISRYVNGHMAPKITTIHAMASFLGVNPQWLLGHEERRYPSEDSAAQTLSAQEQELVAAYRRNPAMQEPVRRLLGLPSLPARAPTSTPEEELLSAREPAPGHSAPKPPAKPRPAASAPIMNDAPRLKLLSAIFEADSPKEE